MGIGRKQVWVHIPYASCCFGEWHPWLQEVDCCDPKILTDTCYRVLDLGLWWSSWRELALSGFSQVNKTPPGVLLELTVMSRGVRLMRAFFSPWMMEYLCTPRRSRFCVSDGIVGFFQSRLSYQLDRVHWKTSQSVSNCSLRSTAVRTDTNLVICISKCKRLYFNDCIIYFNYCGW